LTGQVENYSVLPFGRADLPPGKVLQVSGYCPFSTLPRPCLKTVWDVVPVSAACYIAGQGFDLLIGCINGLTTYFNRLR
jgi:hypothetical protein